MKLYFFLVMVLFFSIYSFSQNGEAKTFELNKDELLIEKSLPPILNITDLQFIDENNNNTIEGIEKTKIKFTIHNSGKGYSRGLTSIISNTNPLVSGLIFNPTLEIGSIASNSSKTVEVLINGSMEISSGYASIEINFDEKNGFPPNKIKINIPTKSFDSPKIEVVDYSFLSEKGNVSLGFPLQLKVLIQNTGQGIGEDIKVEFTYPNSIVSNGEEKFRIGSLNSGAQKEIIYDFFATKNHKEPSITIHVNISEKYKKFAIDKDVTASINEKTNEAINLNLESKLNSTQTIFERGSLSADIDKNIPINPIKYPNRYAIIIGNEDYASRQNGLSTESNVAFAKNDAQIFKNYALNTFGIDENHITILFDATSSEIKREIRRLQDVMKYLNGEGELIFYYAGHGYPDELTKAPYIIPVDVTASNISDGINLFNVYKQLTESNPKKVTVFLDACFSGGGREAGLVASRALKIKPKNEIITGNLVVFSATTEEQSALPYRAKNHGMFTYHLLKKIQESNGNISYESLFNHVSDKVAIESLDVNRTNQKPQILFSEDVYDTWKTWRIN